MHADLDQLLTLPGVLDVANRGDGGMKVIDRLERLNEGFRVVAGPYAVDVADVGRREAERRACVRVVRDQRRVGCAVRVIQVGAVVYVLRAEEGWQSQRGGGLGAMVRGLAADGEEGL